MKWQRKQRLGDSIGGSQRQRHRSMLNGGVAKMSAQRSGNGAKSGISGNKRRRRSWHRGGAAGVMKMKGICRKAAKYQRYQSIMAAAHRKSIWRRRRRPGASAGGMWHKYINIIKTIDKIMAPRLAPRSISAKNSGAAASATSAAPHQAQAPQYSRNNGSGGAEISRRVSATAGACALRACVCARRLLSAAKISKWRRAGIEMLAWRNNQRRRKSKWLKRGVMRMAMKTAASAARQRRHIGISVAMWQRKMAAAQWRSVQ
jgi:hypothetical protein